VCVQLSLSLSLSLYASLSMFLISGPTCRSRLVHVAQAHNELVGRVPDASWRQRQELDVVRKRCLESRKGAKMGPVSVSVSVSE
jgi:hypothetical protein